MPTVSAGDLLLLRADGHKSDVYTSFLPNIILWEARINDGSIVQGETSIDFNAGTGSFYALIEALQEVWVGSASEANDVGRLRIKSISSGDGGVTGTVTVAGHSLPLQDDDYLTFHHNYPLKPRYSWVDPSTEIWYMDDDVVYSDQHEEPPPIVIAGPHRGGFLVSGSFVINVNSSNSYVVAAGASISSYALTVASTAGTPTVNFNTGTGLGDITFTDPGDYWAKYTVTDSNGKSQVSYRWYFVCEKDRSSAFHPFVDAETITLTGDWEQGGWIAGIEAKDGYSLDEIPFHTLCVIWRESWYGSTKKAITFLPDSATTIFAGYVRGEVEEQDFEQGLGHVDLIISTVEGRLRRMYSFSASIVANTPVNHWKYGPNWMTVGIIAAYLMRWRSTIFEVTDVLGLKDNTWLEAGFEPDDNNLYDMVNNYTLDEGIRAKLVCDKGGRLILSYDNQLLIDSERSALLTTFDIKKDPDAADYGGSLIVARAPEPEAPFVTSNGVYWDGTTYDEDGRPEATGDWCVIAPGGKPLHEGPNPMDFPAQIIPSLDYLKQLAGRYLAKANNEIEEVRISFSGDYLGVLEVAYDNSVFTMSLQASDMPRGVAWNAKPLYLRNVVARFSGATGLFECNASFEPEAAGITGIETECPSFPLLGGEIPDIPLPEAAPGALVTGSSLHQKLTSENAWTELHTDDIDDLIEDPYWQIKQGSYSPSDAILIECGLGYIGRSTDGGVTFSDVTPTTDPPNDAGDSPAPTVANVRFNMLDASYTSQHDFVVLVTWQNASSEWRTWVYFTDDNFATNGDWASVGGGSGNDLTSFNTPDVLHGEAPGYHDPDPYWSEGYRGGHSIVRLSSTKFVVSYQENAGETYTYEAYLQVVDIQGDGTLIVGPKRGFWNYVDNGDVNEVHGQKIFFWDSQHVIILSHEYDYEFNHDGLGEGHSFLARIALISGNNVTFGDPIEIDNDYYTSEDFYPYHWWFDKTPGLNNWGIITYSDWQFGPSNQNVGMARMIQKTGSLTVAVSPSSYEWAPDEDPGCDSFSVTSIDINNSVVFFSTGKDTGSGTFQIHCVHLTNTGYSITPGSVQYLGGQCYLGVRSIMLDENRFIFVREASGLYATSVSKSGTTYTVESNYTISSDSDVAWNNFSFHALSSSRFACFWDSGAAWGIWAKIVYMTGTYTMSGGTPASIEQGGTFSETVAQGIFASSSFVAAYWYDSYDDTVNAATAPLPIGYEAKGLGISFGKGLGNRAWVTIWDNAEGLSLVDIDIPALTENGRYPLGAASEAEMNNKTWVVYPFAAYGDDDICILYGRMDAPQSLSSPQHIIVTQNGGSSFQSIYDGWGVDHAGSLYFSAGGDTFIVLNRFNQSKLYKLPAGGAMALLSTMPFTAQVAPHGMFVNRLSEDVFVASWAADSIMVVKLPPPYFTISDLTYDHDNTEGIQSIIQL